MFAFRRFLKKASSSYLSRQQVNDFEAVLDDADGHELLAVVSAVHHQRVDEALHDRALRLAEALRRVTSRRVRKVLGELVLNRDVIL